MSSSSSDSSDSSRLATLVTRSRPAAAGRWIVNAARNSRLYNWLIAEPDPEVIVIDLRETWTVGPFIRILDSTVDTLAPWYRQSILKRDIDTTAAVLAWAADTRPGRVLARLFKPPKPPEQDDRSSREQDEI